MSGELVRRDTDSWVDVLGPIGDLAERVYRTEFVPGNLRDKKAAVAACILTGREVGLGPMTSLQGIDVIDGTPSLNAELSRALVLAAGHRLRYIETTTTRCIVEGYRKGDDEPTARVTFTMDDAKRMGLDGKSNWRKDPEGMLVARATSRLCRRAFADVIAGMGYTADELEDVEPPPSGSAPTDRRTAKRAPRKATAERVDQPATAEPAPEPVAVDEPPLEDSNEATRNRMRRETEEHFGLEPGELADADVPLNAAEANAINKAAPQTDQPLTKPQSDKMHALFNDCGWTDRDDRLRAVTAIVGRPVTTSKDLTKAEASEVIEALTFAAAAADPATRLEEIVATASDAQQILDAELLDE